MDARAWLSVLFVAAGVMPLLSFWCILRDAVKEKGRYKGVQPGTFGDFDIGFNPSAREEARAQLVTRPIRDTVLVGGGVVVASVASILSMFVLD